jgi:ABC-type branched-subunit amino acid transport system permease subunit
MKKYYFIALLFVNLIPTIAFAQDTFWQVPPIIIPNVTRFPDIYGVVGEIINVLLLLAGIVALIYLIFAGYAYFTAGGNPEQAAQAKSKALSAVVGLIIVLAAWAIVWFIFTRLPGFIPYPNAANNI